MSPMSPETFRLFLAAVIRAARESKMSDEQIARELDTASATLIAPSLSPLNLIISTDKITIIAPLGPDPL